MFALIGCKENATVSVRSVIGISSLEEDFAVISFPNLRLKINIPAEDMGKFDGQFPAFMCIQHGLNNTAVNFETKHFRLVVKDHIFLPRPDGVFLPLGMKNP